jgi:predicted DNA-binding protein
MKTTFRLPCELRAAMRNAARKAYGPKGKSRWVREALEQLFKEDPALGSVGAAEDLAQNDALDMVDLGNRCLATSRTQLCISVGKIHLWRVSNH